MISIRKICINKKDLPICKNCVNFIADNAKYVKCKKVYEINLIISNKEYKFAYIARSDYNLCGKLVSFMKIKK
jgi:hypothetical protein